MAAGERPRRVDRSAAERGRERLDDVGGPPAAPIAGPRRSQRVDHVVRRRAVGRRGPEAIQVDGMAGGEVLLEPQVDRHVPVRSLDHGARARVQEGAQLERGDGRLAEGDTVAPHRDLEVGERRPAFLVRLEGAELRARRHDPVAQAGEHRTGGHRAVEGLQGTPVELRDRHHPREARRREPGRSIGRIAGRGDRPRLRERHELEGLVIRERGQLHRRLVRDRGDPEEGGRLVARVGRQLVRHRGGHGARGGRGGHGGHPECPAGADHGGEDEADHDAEGEEVHRSPTG